MEAEEFFKKLEEEKTAVLQAMPPYWRKYYTRLDALYRIVGGDVREGAIVPSPVLKETLRQLERMFEFA